MSQIFEALRRSRQQAQQDGGARRAAQADSVLATMGFESERKAAPRASAAPIVLVVLLGVMAWAGWRWYAGADATPVAPVNRVAQPHAPTQPPAQTSARPTAVQPTAAIATPPAAATRVSQPGAAPSAPLVSSAPPPAVERAQPRARVAARPDAFQLALYYHRAGDFEKALLQYRAVLEQNELNAQAHNNLGLLYRDKGLLDDAVRQFQRALLIDNRYGAARNNLGVALLGLGRADESAAELRRVLEQDARNVDAMVNLALAEKSAGRSGVAMETLVRALGIDPRSAPAHYNLAVLYEQTGETARAMDHYRAFLEHAGVQHAARTPEVRARLTELAKRG